MTAAARDFVDLEKGVETVEEALQGASDIIAEEISDDAAIRKTLRELYLHQGILVSRAAAKEPEVEEKLPADEFIRVHRSFIVRMDCISAIGRSTLLIEQKDVPIGDAYRERVKGYVSRLAVL